MTKHLFWGAIVLVIAVIVAYLVLVLTGHSVEAEHFGSGVVGTGIIVGTFVLLVGLF